jgi:hypothetical protein
MPGEAQGETFAEALQGVLVANNARPEDIHRMEFLVHSDEGFEPGEDSDLGPLAGLIETTGEMGEAVRFYRSSESLKPLPLPWEINPPDG